MNTSGRVLHDGEGRIIEPGASFSVSGPVERALVDEGFATVPTSAPVPPPVDNSANANAKE